MFNSTWGQQNQQQQPQQGGGLFGGSGAGTGGFGQQNTTGGFGQQQTGGFGQPTQQQNTGGGLFGSSASTNSGFGGFGGQNTQQNNAFGARPTFGATGSSTFGQTNTNTQSGGLFGSTSNTFGANTGASASNTGGLFGAPKPATTGFGTNTSSNIFGAPKPATSTLFGGGTNTAGVASNNVFGAPQQPQVPVPPTGTLNPPYDPPWQQDPGATSIAGKDTPRHKFHVITAMPTYQNASLEELRLMDYINGNKQPPPGQSTFGQPQPQTTTGFGQQSVGGFGTQPSGSSTFGQPAGGGMFGSSATSGFGSNTSTGFGQQQTPGSSLFGQPQQQQQQQSPFGQTNTSTGGGLFGGQPQTNTGGGLFGSGGTTSGGLFGQTQQQPPGQTGFGSSFGAPKPAFGTFGQQSTAPTNTFGQPAQATTTASSGFTFGQQPQQQTQQQPAAGGGLFGSAGSTFGQTNTQQAPGTSLFGQPQGQAQQPAAGGLFSSSASKPAGSLFGSSAPAGTTSSFGGFGQPAQTQPAGSLFGNTPAATAPAAGSSLFGAQQSTTTQQPASGGLFGNTAGTASGSLFGAKPAAPAGGGLFGSTATPATQPAQSATTFGQFGQTAGAAGGGLFGSAGTGLGQQAQPQAAGLGAKPAGSLFGAASGGGLFGQTATQPAQQTAAPSGGLFGSLNSQPQSSGLFGSITQPATQSSLLGQSGAGGFGFGNQSIASAPQQPSLTASVDQNPYGRNELFAYSGQKLDLSVQNKKPALPPLTASAFRVTPSKGGRITRLRGFASPHGASQSPRAASPAPMNGSLSSPATSILGSPAQSDRYKGLSDVALSPNAFIPRPSVKKITVTPKMTHNGTNGVGVGSGSDDPLESVLGKSALKTSANSAHPTPDRTASRSPAMDRTTLDDTPSRKLTQAAPAATTPGDSIVRVAGSERPIKRGEYWCRPRLDRLRAMSHDDLSRLENFTAGRKGYGEVTFLEPVDLTSLPSLGDLLGGIIIVEDLELVVYPDDSNKPPRGKGLNVPAQISLENCFARDKATKQPITDPSDPRYQRQLKRVKSVPDTEFISFTEDGTWTFKVEHFSRYGLSGSDEEDDEENIGQSQYVSKVGNNQKEQPESYEEDEDFLPPTKSIHDILDGDEHDSGIDTGASDPNSDERDDEMNSDEEEDEVEDVEHDFNQAPSTTAEWDKPLQNKLGAQGMRNLRAMQNAFFGNESSSGGIGNMKSTTKLSTPAHARVKRALPMQDFEKAEETEARLGDRAVKRASFGKVASPPKLRQPRKYSKVALKDSLSDGQENLRSDTGLSLGRSFRCSFGPNGELVHFGKICKPTEKFTSSSDPLVFVEQVNLVSDSFATENARAQRLLQLHLSRTTIEAVDGVPQATLGQVRFRDFASTFSAGDRSHEASLWKLGQALFDEIDLGLSPDSSDDLVSRIGEVRRKLALTRWLEDAVASSVDHDLVKAADNRPAKIFALLSGNQVDRAVQSALDGNDMRLATLVSQIGGNDVFRDEVYRQLEDWQKYKVNSLIGYDYRKVYALLAGISDISPGDTSKGIDACPDVLVAEGLDWKRAFGLRLWFGCSFDQTISQVLESYTLALRGSHPPARPLPPYLESTASTGNKLWNLSEPRDILFNMIQLYADLTVSLDTILETRSFTPSPTDFRLPWHLYMLLSRVLAKRDFQDREVDNEGVHYSATADRVTSAYADQLEQSGMWTWAAFVLLHLEKESSRQIAIKSLLFRHATSEEEDGESGILKEKAFLVDTLKVPVEWIHEAKAAQHASSGDVYSEYFELIKAGLYDRAERILISQLVPEVLLRDDRALLHRLCSALEDKPSAAGELGPKLLVEYLNLIENAPPLLRSVLRAGSHPDPQEYTQLSNFAQSLPRVIRLIPGLFPDKSNVQQVASLSDMLESLYSLAGVLHMAGFTQRPPVSDLLVERDRLYLLQSASHEAFDRSLAAIASA